MIEIEEPPDRAKITPPTPGGVMTGPSSPRADHPHTDPGDGRTECERCGKYVWPAIHSCKGVPVTGRARARLTRLWAVYTSWSAVGGVLPAVDVILRDQLTAKVRPEAHAAVQGVEPIGFYDEHKVSLTDADLAERYRGMSS